MMKFIVLPKPNSPVRDDMDTQTLLNMEHPTANPTSVSSSSPQLFPPAPAMKSVGSQAVVGTSIASKDFEKGGVEDRNWEAIRDLRRRFSVEMQRHN